jgi:hypothetical protein
MGRSNSALEFIEDQLNWGEYVHGYWNFSNADKLQITEGLTLVYGKTVNLVYRIDFGWERRISGRLWWILYKQGGNKVLRKGSGERI